MIPEEMIQLNRELAEWPMEWTERDQCVSERLGQKYYEKVWVNEDNEIMAYSKDWHPTSDPKQAFMVVEAIYNLLNYQLWLTDEPRHFPNSEAGKRGNWSAEFSGNLQNGEIFEAIAGTPELAICLAAKAVKDSRK
jgi:hypothetical protein